MLVRVASPAALAERGPRSLPYRQSGGGMQLAAVEFAFSRDTPVRELDAILSLSIARWHQLTRHCTKPPTSMWIATMFPYAHGDGLHRRALRRELFDDRRLNRIRSEGSIKLAHSSVSPRARLL